MTARWYQIRNLATHWMCLPDDGFMWT